MYTIGSLGLSTSPIRIPQYEEISLAQRFRICTTCGAFDHNSAECTAAVWRGPEQKSCVEESLFEFNMHLKVSVQFPFF